MDTNHDSSPVWSASNPLMISKIHRIPIPRKSFKKVKNLNGIVFHWKPLKVDNLCLRLFYHESIYCFCTWYMQVQIFSFFFRKKKNNFRNIYWLFFIFVCWIPFHVFRPLSSSDSKISGLFIQCTYCFDSQRKHYRIGNEGGTNRQEKPDALCFRI